MLRLLSSSAPHAHANLNTGCILYLVVTSVCRLGSTKDLCSIGRLLLENVSVFRHVKVVSGYMSLAVSTFFVSSTGNFNIIYWYHMKKMKTPDTLTTL